jgi:hypothetical protein
MRQHAIKLLILLLFYSNSGYCVIITKDNIITDKNIQLSVSGMTAIEEGQFVESHHDTLVGNNGNQPMWVPSPGPIWLHRAYARLTFDAFVQDRLHIIVSPEVKLYVDSYPLEEAPSPKNSYFFSQRSFVDIADGEGIYSFGDLNKPFLQFVAGVFPYKYDPDATNLGEYLFRSGCYPPYLLTSFDEPYARLSGLQLKFNPMENLKFDVLLTTETQVQPLYDWSLSFISEYKISSFLDVGAGVSFNRLFSVFNDVTTPTTPSTGSTIGNEYMTASGDSSYYSFKGTKLMGMLSIDPKKLLPPNLADIFGKEDCKIFGEAAVLGIKDYPAYKYRNPNIGDSALILDSLNNYYGNILNRIPIMFGLNVPTFKWLDILSIQGEWYGWPYMDAFYYVNTAGINATPIPRYIGYTRDDYKKDNWKWSVYAKKTLAQHFSIIGQMSRDHTHHDIYFEAAEDDNEVFTRTNEWGWWMKLQYNF